MHILKTVLCIAFPAAMVFSAARTAWVVYHEGMDSERTTSWILYRAMQQWPWFMLSVGAAAGIAYADRPDILAVGVFLGHVGTPMFLRLKAALSASDTGAAQ